MLLTIDLLDLLPRLPLSPNRLSVIEPESVSLLDVALFLIHATYSARCRIDEQGVGGVLTLPDLMTSLCTEDQQNWWSSVYGVCSLTGPSTRCVFLQHCWCILYQYVYDDI